MTPACMHHLKKSESFGTGIHFLSGGMSEEEATLNLQALQVEFLSLY
jgi:fructose-bisphosphate aldolase class 1